MKSLLKKEITITLVLNESEALYLKGLMQNYTGDSTDGPYRTEPEEEKQIRENFFKTLDKYV